MGAFLMDSLNACSSSTLNSTHKKEDANILSIFYQYFIEYVVHIF